MKKIAAFTFALAAAAATSLLLYPNKQKNTPASSAQYEELSTALKTNKILQVIVIRDIKDKIKDQNAPAAQKLHRQLKSLQNNEQLLKQEIKEIYPKPKKRNNQ